MLEQDCASEYSATVCTHPLRELERPFRPQGHSRGSTAECLTRLLSLAQSFPSACRLVRERVLQISLSRDVFCTSVLDCIGFHTRCLKTNAISLKTGDVHCVSVKYERHHFPLAETTFRQVLQRSFTLHFAPTAFSSKPNFRNRISFEICSRTKE